MTVKRLTEPINRFVISLYLTLPRVLRFLSFDQENAQSQET
jgi:hypothetical protein